MNTETAESAPTHDTHALARGIEAMLIKHGSPLHWELIAKIMQQSYHWTQSKSTMYKATRLAAMSNDSTVVRVMPGVYAAGRYHR